MTLFTIKGLLAKVSIRYPQKFEIPKSKIVYFVPILALITPDATQNKAPPSGMADTASENSLSLTGNSWLSLRIFGPEGELHPSDIPRRKLPKFARMSQSHKTRSKLRKKISPIVLIVACGRTL